VFLDLKKKIKLKKFFPKWGYVRAFPVHNTPTDQSWTGKPLPMHPFTGSFLTGKDILQAWDAVNQFLVLEDPRNNKQAFRLSLQIRGISLIPPPQYSNSTNHIENSNITFLAPFSISIMIISSTLMTAFVFATIIYLCRYLRKKYNQRIITDNIEDEELAEALELIKQQETKENTKQEIIHEQQQQQQQQQQQPVLYCMPTQQYPEISGDSSIQVPMFFYPQQQQSPQMYIPMTHVDNEQQKNQQ